MTMSKKAEFFLTVALVLITIAVVELLASAVVWLTGGGLKH